MKRRLRLVDSREGGLLGRKGGEAESVAFVLAFFLVSSLRGLRAESVWFVFSRDECMRTRGKCVSVDWCFWMFK